MLPRIPIWRNPQPSTIVKMWLLARLRRAYLGRAIQELPTIRFDDPELSPPGTMNTDFIFMPEAV